MKPKYFIFFIFLFQSCNWFENRVPKKDALLQKELKSIDWNAVDELPSVAECDKIEDKAQRNQCFFEILTQLIQQKLSSDTLQVLYPKLDTVEVKVTVFADATLSFEPEFKKDSLVYDAVKIDSILKVRLVHFPKINPAIKRGIPVKTQFILPVILKVE